MLPPFFVVEIPGDGLLDAFFEGRLREPAQLVMDLCGIDGIAAVVAGAIFHVLDEGFRLAERGEDGLHHGEVIPLVVPADVVHFPFAAFPDNEVDGAAVVFGVEPVPHVCPVAVDGEGLVLQRMDKHEGDELLRKLVRAVVVGAAGDGHGHAVGAVPCLYEEVGRRFRGRVRAGRMEGRGLCEEKVFPLERQVAVHFVGRDLMETTEAVEAARIEEYAGPHDVRLKEDARVGDGAVHVALCGEVHHHVGFFVFKQLVNEFSVCNVSAHEGEARFIPDGCKRLEVPRIGELVQAEDLVVRMGQLVIDEIAPDKSGSAGNDDLHTALLRIQARYLSKRDVSYLFLTGWDAPRPS